MSPADESKTEENKMQTEPTKIHTFQGFEIHSHSRVGYGPSGYCIRKPYQGGAGVFVKISYRGYGNIGVLKSIIYPKLSDAKSAISDYLLHPECWEEATRLQKIEIEEERFNEYWRRTIKNIRKEIPETSMSLGGVLSDESNEIMNILNSAVEKAMGIIDSVK